MHSRLKSTEKLKNTLASCILLLAYFYDFYKECLGSVAHPGGVEPPPFETESLFFKVKCPNFTRAVRAAISKQL